jgi:hypothetical protein
MARHFPLLFELRRSVFEYGLAMSETSILEIQGCKLIKAPVTLLPIFIARVSAGSIMFIQLSAANRTPP